MNQQYLQTFGSIKRNSTSSSGPYNPEVRSVKEQPWFGDDIGKQDNMPESAGQVIRVQRNVGPFAQLDQNTSEKIKNYYEIAENSS